jgi:hexosaminidase
VDAVATVGDGQALNRASEQCQIPDMRHTFAVLVLGLAVTRGAPEGSLQLRWELKEDVFPGPTGERGSRAAFTLTNRGTKPLAARGWAIYFNVMHDPVLESARGGLAMERVSGKLLRIVPGPDFQGLAPGASAEFEYLASYVANVSFVPIGPYVVFDDAPERGHPLKDYKAVPLERAVQSGRDPGVVTPEAQYALGEAVRDIPVEQLPPVFPTPLSLQKREGQLVVETLPSVSAPPELRAEADFALEYLRPRVAKPSARAAPPAAVRLETGPVEGAASSEGYELVVDPSEGIRIRGRSPAGVFYGAQSLRSLLPAPVAGTPLVLPALRIVDAPRFGYRGFMLDVARNFQPKASVLRAVDLMARYKLNTLHLHLTDDEGWRVEIPSLPELTSVGGRRGHTVDSSAFLPAAFGSGPEVGRPFGSGFYSRTEYAEILKYAAARHIEVVPEVEMPGHGRAAIKAMEARSRALARTGDAGGAKRFLLSDPDDLSRYTSPHKYHDNVMNPALPSTYAFIEQVVEDLAAIHREADVPLRSLHVGGDEVPAGVWERSPAVFAYMKEHDLGTVDDLWFVFYAEVEKILRRHDITPSGWEEIAVRKTRLDGKPKNIPNPAFADRGWRAYVWNNVPGDGNEDLAYRLANGGYKVVLCPVTNLYFDLAWNKNPEEPGLDWGGYVDLRKAFEFIPFDYYRNVRTDKRGNPVPSSVFVGKDRLTDYGRSNILGIQGALWSETLNAEGRMEHMLVPKLLGLVERAWAPEPAWAGEADEAKSASLFQDAWSEFVNVVGKRELPRLDRESPGLDYRIPTPGLKIVDGQVRCSLEIPGFVLRYTTDGSDPTPRSPEVRGPIPAKGLVRAAAFTPTGRKGHTAKIAAP